MTTIDSLPLEVLCHIFDLADFDSDIDRRKFLLACALVCVEWRDCAQRALFSDLSFGHDSDALEWLASPARTRYSVRSLRLDSAPEDLSGETAKSVVQACSGVMSFEIDVRSTWQWTESWASAFPELSGLRSLTLVDSRTGYLTIGPFIGTASIASLTLQLDYGTPLATHFREMLSSAMTSNLTTLCLTASYGTHDDYPSPFSPLLPFITLRAPSITSLSLVAFPRAPTFVDTLPLFTTLNRLTIDLTSGILAFNEDFEYLGGTQHARAVAPHLAALAAAVPESVSLLVFTRGEEIPGREGLEAGEAEEAEWLGYPAHRDGDGLLYFTEHLGPFVAEGNCVGVRTIAFPEWGQERLEACDGGEEFLEACEGRGIAVVFP